MGKSLRGKRLKRLGLFWVGVFLSFSLWAQTGVICGTVTDAKIKEPLIGASVVIEGTTVGAITDIDGNFRIENVKPGTYTVAASYVSYQTQTVKDVPVVACQEAVLNIELSDANLQLQNVVVVAQRKLGTEMAVLNTVRKSLPVVNGISAQQIIADGVAEAVVDAFQVVHVKDDTGGRSFDEFHIVEQLFALALVRQSRVKVDVGFLFQLAVGMGNFDCGNRFICHLEIRLAHVYQIRRSVFSGSDLLNFIFQFIPVGNLDIQFFLIIFVGKTHEIVVAVLVFQSA